MNGSYYKFRLLRILIKFLFSEIYIIEESILVILAHKVFIQYFICNCINDNFILFQTLAFTLQLGSYVSKENSEC